MASFRTLLGGFTLICEGKLDFGSFCIQRTIIDVINLVFLFVFYLLLFVCSVRKLQRSVVNKRDRISIVVSICCALISISYLSVGLWNLIARNGEFNGLSWLIELVRGLIWISLSVSLLVHASQPVKIFISAWWVSFALLVSVLHIEILFRTHRIEIFDVLPWPVNILMLFCAFRNFIDLTKEHESLSEPLLEEKEETYQIEVCEANFFSKLSFSWINPLLSRGYLRPLALEDIPSISAEDESSLAYQKFANAWETLIREKSSIDRRNLVLRALTKVYFKENIVIAVCAILRTISVVALPLLLYAFVNYSNQEEENLQKGLVLLGFLIVLKVVESLSQRYWYYASRRCGMRMRSALMVAVYQKQLKLSSLGRRRHSTGEIVNYIAVDAYRMGEFPWWFHSTWSLVLQLFMSMGVLFSVVGLGAIPGIVPLVICGFLNMPVAKIIQKCQSEVMISQDERLRAISEILNSMKIIKLQSWEDKFKSLIKSLRGKEFKWLSKQQFLRPYGTVLYWISPTIVSSVVFLGCALFGSAPLNAGTIFTVLATLRSMAEPVRMLPEALSIPIQVKVSFDRINTFLLDDELRNDEVRGFPLQNSDKIVTVEAGNFSWVPEIAIPTLRNVELEIKRGQKIAVCGPVGAGKSSILYAMLGEIPKLSGTVSVFGSIAYVSQVSWIQSGTIRDNILYGKPMDADKYDKAINACALDKDINTFDHGDLTEIGQRGINMSGGQKQRIQLARAIYNDADIYLLDDPFSAVDAHTASVLFNDCVMTALAKKTVVLATHQVEFLSEVDRILVMDGGQITQSGSYEELLMAGTAFEQLVNAHRDSITALGSLNGQGEGESRGIAPVMFNGCSPTKHNSEGEISVKGPPGIQLTQDEEVEIGDVGWKPFMDYVSISKGSVYLSLSILTQLTFVVLQATSTYWLAFAIQIPNMTNSMLIGVYTGVATLSAVFVFFRSLYAAYLGLKASKAFHSGLTNAIFKAPMLFFDSTPVGRILTRASSDMSILDFDIPFAFVFVAAGVTEVLATIGIMAFITWQVLIVAILAMVGVKYIQGYYMSSARELIRINGTTKAPVINYAAETSLGVVTIRAFNMVDMFFRNNLKLVDTDATLFFLSNAAMEWLVLRIETLQNLTLFTAAFFLLLLPKNQVTPGLVGLSLSYALSLTGTQIPASRWYCSLWNYMISVERIKQFMHIPEEPPAIIEDNRPPSSWPSKGRIELQELKIRYSSNAPLVLKGITCTFQEGTRVGVVGRTGSGKTTLISTLFRLVEPASGKILIDGLDICSMGLKDLRMKLSIIPQEPTLFRGSIRTNLDPLGLYSDDEIWKALEKCQLKTTISALPNKLDSSVSDEGENWSVGQRQLFCLGRVLLKRNRILVLDEATASIDSATDAILQRIIREEFSNCTVITVAHRVPTVIDSDMVMVLSYGKLLEYDEPSNLMATNSSFSKLVAEYWSSCRRNPYQNFSSYQ
ncbi:ABC transporter C family member 8-like isoform X2 [Gossypium raimondii]|uniref:ABC transporter C family member 8-like isoform X1 n=1 Tax=Gossypium raimondii TaxID=29730 RepID=UPI00227B5EC8|nr:ABC transporter C family member 8-like isoform X1 [Gossypium raimondii]XP_052478821.1 ABC transporter C family member 8-like isoform X2 [Gossypium raimondii]